MNSLYTSTLTSFLLILFLNVAIVYSTEGQIPVTEIQTESIEMDLSDFNGGKPLNPKLSNFYGPCFYLGAVRESLEIKEQTFAFNTWDDDSGGNDKFNSSYDNNMIKSTSATYGINAGVDIIFPKVFLGLDYTYSWRGKSNLSTFNLALGRVIPIKLLHMIPKISVGFGRAKMKLGEMENDQTEVRIEGKSFTSEEVNVYLKTRVLQAAPGLDFHIPIGEKGTRLRMGVSYKFGLPFNERVKYEGEGGPAHRPFAHENHAATVDEEVLFSRYQAKNEKIKMFNFSGLRFELGLGWKSYSRGK